MAQEAKPQGGDLFIVDNSEKDWKVLRYLHDWADLAHTFDIATGYFDIGSLLALDGQWQKLDLIRILMGDQVTSCTRKVLLDGVRAKLNESIEREKETNDFLTGVPAVVSFASPGTMETLLMRLRMPRPHKSELHGRIVCPVLRSLRITLMPCVKRFLGLLPTGVTSASSST